MPESPCTKCGNLNSDGIKFCGSCGNSVASPELAATSEPSATSKLIELITATMRNGDVANRLNLCDEFFRMRSDRSDSCIAWAMKLYCYVQLGQLKETQECQHNARRDYAIHLGLSAKQTEEYLADPLAIRPLSFDEDLQLRKHIDEPHLLELFDSIELTSTPKSFIGDTAAEKGEKALETWVRGIEPDDRNEIKFCGLLAFLYIKLAYYDYATQVLEVIVRKDAFYESLGSPSYPLFWANILAGKCYDMLGKTNLAINKWHQVRSYDMMRESIHFFDLLGAYWIDQAKELIRNKGLALPSIEQSRIAQTHLFRAWQWDERAHAEIEGLGLYDWATLLKDHGDDFRAFVSESAKEVSNADSMDPFAVCKVAEDEDGSSTWRATNDLKAAIFHKKGLVYLAVDNFDSAIREFQQSIAIKSSMQSTVYLAFAFDGKGAKKEARELYLTCINRSDTIAARFESEEDRQNFAQLAHIFMNEM